MLFTYYCCCGTTGQIKAESLDVIKELRADGIQPALSGDIWEENGKAFLALVIHWMTREMKPLSMVLCLLPFSKDTHTGMYGFLD